MLACALHPDAAAGWRCPSHGPLCPACAGVRQAGYGRLEVCGRCGELAERLRAPRRLLRPYSSTLLGALAFPLQRAGLLSILIAAAALRLLSALGPLGALFAWGTIAAWLFQIVRHTAAGHDDFPRPDDFRGLFEDLLAPLLRALLAGAWLALPLALWAFLDPGAAPDAWWRSLRDPAGGVELAPLLALLAGALLAPLALLAGALRTPLVQLANPLLGLLRIAALGADYWLLALFAVLCGVAGAASAAGVSSAGARLGLPLPGFFAALAALYFPFVAFRAIGLLVRARGDALGYGSAAEYLEPVLDAEPQVRLGEPLRPLAPGESPSAVPGGTGWEAAAREPVPDVEVLEELAGPDVPADWPLITPPHGSVAPTAPRATPPDAAAAPAPALAAGPAPAAERAPNPPAGAPRPTPPPPAAPAVRRTPPSAPVGAAPAAPRTPPPAPQRLAPPDALLTPPAPPVDQLAAVLLARRITDRDLDGAVRAFAEAGLAVPARTLSAQAWVDLARACLERTRPPGADPAAAAAMAGLAVLAYRRAAEVGPKSQLAPHAFLQAARLYDELLGDRARSDRLLAELARRYPQTAEGQFAAKRLAGR